RLADLDDVQMMLDRLPADRRIRITERAELVAERLTRLVLKRVGVDSVEAQAESLGVDANGVEVQGLIPRNVKRDPRRCANELVHERNVCHLLAQGDRLAESREAAKASAAGRKRPRRKRNLESLNGGDHRIGDEPIALEALSQFREVPIVLG